MSIVRRILVDNELRRTARHPAREWFKDDGMSHYVHIDKIIDQNRDILEPGVVLIGFSRDSEHLISYTLAPCSENDFDLEERNICSVQIWVFSFHRPLRKLVDLLVGPPVVSAFDNVETIEAGPLFVVHCYDQVSEYYSHEMISVFPSPLLQYARSCPYYKSAFINFDLHSSCRSRGFPSSLVLQCTDIPGVIIINNGNTVSAWLFKKLEDPASKSVSVTRRVMTFVDVQQAAFSLMFKHFKYAYTKSVTSFDSVFMCSNKGFFVVIHVLVSVCEREFFRGKEKSPHATTYQKQSSEIDSIFCGDEDGMERYGYESGCEKFKDSFAHIRAVLFLDYGGLGTKVASVSVQRNVSPTMTIEKVVEADRKVASEMYSTQLRNRPWETPFHCTNASVASGMESLPVLSHPLLPIGLIGFQSVF